MEWYSQDILILILISWYYQPYRISSKWHEYKKISWQYKFSCTLIHHRIWKESHYSIMILSVIWLFMWSECCWISISEVDIMRLSWYYKGLTRSLTRNQNLRIISWYYQYFDFSCEGLVVEYSQVNIMQTILIIP